MYSTGVVRSVNLGRRRCEQIRIRLRVTGARRAGVPVLQVRNGKHKHGTSIAWVDLKRRPSELNGRIPVPRGRVDRGRPLIGPTKCRASDGRRPRSNGRLRDVAEIDKHPARKKAFSGSPGSRVSALFRNGTASASRFSAYASSVPILSIPPALQDQSQRPDGSRSPLRRSDRPPRAHRPDSH